MNANFSPCPEKMHIVLTGAGGFVGRHLLDAFRKQNIGLTVLGRKRPPGWEGNFYAIDLSNPSTLGGALHSIGEIDLVIHAAGSLSENCREINHLGTSALLEVLAPRTKQWLQLSSAGVYENRFTGSISESSPEKPATPYEQSKLDADRAVAAVFPNAIFLRPTMVVGPGMKGSPIRALAQVIRRRLVPKANEHNVLNMVAVQDVVSVILKFAGDPQLRMEGGTYLLSDDLPVRRVIQLIQKRVLADQRTIPVPEPLLRCVALLGAFLRLPLYNLKRHRNLWSCSTFSSSKLEEKIPRWRLYGAEQAVMDVLDINGYEGSPAGTCKTSQSKYKASMR